MIQVSNRTEKEHNGQVITTVAINKQTNSTTDGLNAKMF